MNDTIQVQQSTYIKNLEPIPVHPARAVEQDAPLTDQEIDILWSKICQILWVARQTRPDVMCDVSILASSTKDATVQTLHSANKIIRKLNNCRGALEIPAFRQRQLITASSVQWFVNGQPFWWGHSGGTSNHAHGREWKILTHLLAVKKSGKGCEKHFGRRDPGPCRWHWQCNIFGHTVFRTHSRWLRAQRFTYCMCNWHSLTAGCCQVNQETTPWNQQC